MVEHLPAWLAELPYTYSHSNNNNNSDNSQDVPQPSSECQLAPTGMRAGSVHTAVALCQVLVYFS